MRYRKQRRDSNKGELVSANQVLIESLSFFVVSDPEDMHFIQGIQLISL